MSSRPTGVQKRKGTARPTRRCADSSTTAEATLIAKQLIDEDPEPTRNVLPPLWQSFVEDPKAHLTIGLDFGTTKWALAWAFQFEHTTPTNVHIHNIEFANDPLQASPIGFWFQEKDGKEEVRIVHGNEVDTNVQAGNIRAEHVIKNFKQSKLFENAEEVAVSGRKTFLHDLQETHAKILEAVAGKPCYVWHPWCGRRRVKPIASEEDLAHVLFELILMDTKQALRLESNLSQDQLDEMFGGDKDTTLGRKIRTGVAAPEIWKRQRELLYRLLTESGWPPFMEILSEGKCAAAMALRDKFDEIEKLPPKEKAKEIAKYNGKPIHIIDIGGHTLDQSTMEIIWRSEFVKFRPRTESTSTQDGGERANDEFLREIPDFFGKSWPKVLEKAAEDGETTTEFRFKNHLMASFEKEKRQPNAPGVGSRRMILYTGPQDLPNGKNGKIQWRNKKLEVPKERLIRCVKRPVQAILAPDGPLQRHRQLIEAAMPGIPCEMRFTGGGSLNPILQDEVRKNYEDVALQTKPHAQQSLVAKGTILSMLDPEICIERKVANKGYGIVICEEYDPANEQHKERFKEARPMQPHMASRSIEGRLELDNTTKWLAAPGNRVRIENKLTRMQQSISSEGLHPGDVKETTMVVEIVQTIDPALCKDGICSESEGIEPVAIWEIPISKRLAREITRPIKDSVHGYVKHVGTDDWRLEFDYEFRYRWAGMLQFLEVRIPYGGAFPIGREPALGDMYIARYRLTGDVQVSEHA